MFKMASDNPERVRAVPARELNGASLYNRNEIKVDVKCHQQPKLALSLSLWLCARVFMRVCVHICA
jgi:hypothetical protein